MAQDIFVGVLIAVAAIAGIWCWWIDNGGGFKKDKKDKEDEEPMPDKK